MYSSIPCTWGWWMGTFSPRTRFDFGPVGANSDWSETSASPYISRRSPSGPWQCPGGLESQNFAYSCWWSEGDIIPQLQISRHLLHTQVWNIPRMHVPQQGALEVQKRSGISVYHWLELIINIQYTFRGHAEKKKRETKIRNKKQRM